MKWAVWKIPANNTLSVVHAATGLADNVLWPAHNETSKLIKLGYTPSQAMNGLGRGLLDLMTSEFYSLTHDGAEVASQYRLLVIKRVVADTTGKVAQPPSKEALESIRLARTGYTHNKYSHDTRLKVGTFWVRSIKTMGLILLVLAALWLLAHCYQARREVLATAAKIATKVIEPVVPRAKS